MTDLLQFFKKATQAYQAGDMDLALSFIQKIFKKDPNYPQILHLWGTILARMKAFEAAEGKFKQALSRNLNDWEAWNNPWGGLQSPGQFQRSPERSDKS
jgi:Flp pilus assembly protein TadD